MFSIQKLRDLNTEAIFYLDIQLEKVMISLKEKVMNSSRGEESNSSLTKKIKSRKILRIMACTCFCQG